MSRAELIAWFLILFGSGVALNLIVEHRAKLFGVLKAIIKLFIKPKKLRKIQPVIEVFGRNYKKVHKHKFDKVV